jgi:NAD dependent epimerase/dehydratase family enzyme
MPPIPKLLMSIVLGEMHTLLFASQNVSSKKIQNHGFVFKFKQVDKALVDLIE